MNLRSLLWAINDVAILARRNLLALVRIPVALVFSVIQPVMFVLLFRYVFGGSIRGGVPGGYVNYLIPGILVQTTIFGAVGTAIGLSQDLQEGLIERFRALPMSRMAVLAGRTVSDVGRNLLVLVVISLVGFAVGFRPHGGVGDYLLGCLIMMVFAYCLSWGFAFIGLTAPNAESAQAMTFPLIFPLTFASGIFVQVSTMPSWMQGFARNQPITQVTEAVRGLMLGDFHLPTGQLIGHGNSSWIALAWSAGILLVLAPLSVRKYRKVA